MPGPLPGQTVTAGTIFGINQYGTSLYGLGLPPQYLVEPMTAVSNSYTSVLVTWNPPSGTIFRYRLLRNRYGFPVNENDGDIIYDTTTYPGNSYTDLDISPGTYHYYGFYILADIGDNLWIRSGFAGCLAVQDYGSGQYLLGLLPEYFTTIPSTGAALTDDAAGNSQLQLFLNVFGWALDYLQTQYATYANHLNDATFIPLDDLWNLAEQVGLTFSPDVPAYTVRKATGNFAHVAQQRGTLTGIAEEIALRTGYGADVHLGPNLLLDDDQAQILSPIFIQYQATRSYAKDECIWIPHAGLTYPWLWNGDGWWFRSLQNGNLGNTPPSGGSSNSFWQALYDSDDFLGTQGNQVTSGTGTWEVLDTGATSYLPLANSNIQGLGVQAPPPVTPGSNAFAWNTLRMYNRQGSSRTMWMRSVSRRTADLGQIPDSSFELGTTIAPVNQLSSSTWVPPGWPQVTTANWLGGQNQIVVPAYWTPVNATIAREETTVHTGHWAAQITPAGTATPITAPAAVQYPNPSFESPDISGWVGTNCTLTRGAPPSYNGEFSLQVAPEFILTTSSGTTEYAITAGPIVTGPQITAIPGASDTVTLYCAATTAPQNISNYPVLSVGIQYYDADGNTLQTTMGINVTTSSAWAALTATATAPAGCVAKALVVVNNTLGYADNFWLDYITWSQTISESWAALQLNSPWISCPASTACTGSLYYQAASSGSTITAQLVFYDTSGNTLATDSGTPVTGTANTWVNPTVSATAPTGTQYAALQLTITSPVAVSYIDDTTITPTLTLSIQPDQIQAVQDGIPVPWVINSEEWNPAIRYATGSITQYDGQPFTALRASTGSVPPGNNVATTDWAPLSQSHRIRLCLSGYTSQNLTSGTNFSYAVTPFIEWYDQQGNYITRVFARTANNNGTVGQPNNMAFDSFTTQSVIASSGATATTASPGPWNASFWNNTSLSGTPVLTRVDPSVSFTWDGTAPGSGVAASGWSASWITTYTAPAAGSYGFQLQAGQGGSRLIVNGQTIIDNWAAQASPNLTATLTLTAGQVLTIEADYYNPPVPESSYTTSVFPYSDFFLTSFYQLGLYASQWILSENNSFPLNVIPVSPGETLQVSGTASPTEHCTGILTVAWLDIHSQPVITQQQELVSGAFTSSLTAPGGTSYALITFSSSGIGSLFAGFEPFVQCGFHDIQATVQVLTEGTNTDSLAFGTISVPAIPATTAQFSSLIAGRATDDEQSNWVNPLSPTWTIGGFAGGSAWPTSPGTRTLALLTTQPANTSLGITYRSMPQGGSYSGIIFRYSSTSNYWRCDQNQLGYISSGVYTLIAVHSQAFQPGDRMTITLNGNSVTVYRNGTQVNSASNSFNSTATEHGICNDTIASAEAGAGDPLRKMVIRPKTKMPPARGHGSGASRNSSVSAEGASNDPLRKDGLFEPRTLQPRMRRGGQAGKPGRGGRP